MTEETPSPAPEGAADEPVGPSGPTRPAEPPEKPRKRRWLRWVVGLVLFLVLLVAALVSLAWYGVSTERGTHVLLTRLAPYLPGTLTVGSQRGPLLGPLELRDVRYRNEGLDVHLGHLSLDWDAAKLRQRRLDIRVLHAEDIQVHLPAPDKDETSDGKLVDIHLPLNIALRDALIRNLTITRAGAAPFQLDEIALDGESVRASDTILVRSLRVLGPTFRLGAQGSVTPVGAYAVDLKATATYRAPDLPAFSGSGSFTGTLERLGLDVALAAPFTARVQGHVDAPMREPVVDLAAEVRDFEAQKLDATWPAARVSEANVRVQGKLDAFQSQGRVDGAYEDLARGLAIYRLSRRGTDFFIESLHVEEAGGTELDARGTLDTGKKELVADMVADWRSFTWPLHVPRGGAPVVVSRQGQATFKGALSDYAVNVDAQLAGPSVPPGHWVLAGRGDLEKMALRSLRGDVLRGRLTAAGTVAWKPQVRWDLRLTGDALDPGAMVADYPGRLAFTATSRGRLEPRGPYGQVDLTRLAGNVRGNPVDGRIHLELVGDRYRLPRLDLRSGSARITAAGSFTQAAGDLEWRVEAPNLGELLADAGGQVNLQGHLSGPWKAPRVVAKGNGHALVYKTNNVETVEIAADVDLAPRGRIDLTVDAARLGIGERRVDTVALKGQGTRADHAVTLAVRAKEGSFDLALAGGLRGADLTGGWGGQIRRLDLQNEQTGAWALAGPAGLVASPSAAALENFCWTSGGARLCAEGQWAKAGAWNASGTLADLPFALAKPFLPPDLEITGGVNGTFRTQGTAAGVLTAEVELRPGPGEVRYPSQKGKITSIRFEQGTVRLHAGADGLAGTAALAFVDTGTLNAELRMPQYNRIGAPLEQQSLGGRIQASFTNLGLVEAFVPDLRNPKGTLSADVTLGGTVAAPRATGRVALAGAQVDVPAYGLEVRQIELTAQSDDQGVLQIQGKATSGRGTLTLAGYLPLDKRPALLTLQGKRFQFANTRELKGVVSPDLKIALNLPNVDVTGDVVVPEATIAQPKRQRAAIPVSSDVVIIPPSGALGAAPKQALAISARVRVVLGGDVRIDAAGFNGRVVGSLLLTEQPGRPTMAVGELEIPEGVYKSYGQDLTLERGRLVFAGPLENPGLDLRAYRKADDGTVAYLEVAGTLKAPRTTISSDPPMNQSDALAYLILGHPLRQSTAEEGDLVANAANSLGLKGGNLIATKLGARFGLHEARLESTGGLKEASLVVGKYLSPRLYVTYGVGLFSPISTFRIRYILSRNWTLQAEQGAGTSADILYTIERGKGGATPVPRRDLSKAIPVPAAGTERP